VLLVRSVDPSVAEALGYVRSCRPEYLHVVTPGKTVRADLQRSWETFGGSTSLEALGGGSVLGAIRGYIRRLEVGPDDFVTVMIPEHIRGNIVSYLVGSRELVRLKASLLREPHVVVTDVPVLEDPAAAPSPPRPLIPRGTVTLLFVSAINDVTVRAVNYAHTLGAGMTRAVYFDLNPEQANRLEVAWFDAGFEIPLDIVEAPFRDLTNPMLSEVRRYTSRPDTLVNVVIPEVLVSHWWQFPLHNQSALFIKRLFLSEERVVLTSVPYVLSREPDPARVR
jgi:hypothetical protein